MTLLLLACTQQPLPPGGSQPDVILVSIDTLRADHVGAYGYERDTTPYIDSLAARGTRFAHARSASPWTLPSHSTMLSGQLPIHHGAVDSGGGLPKDLPLIQERFQAAGYATGAAVSTLFVGRRFGFARGFDAFEDFGVTNKNNLKGTVDAEDVFKAATDFVRSQEGESVFLFLHLYDVHYPYQAPGDWEEKFDRKGSDDDLRYKNYFRYQKHPVKAEQMAHQVAQYDEEIAYVDDQLRQLVAQFQAAGRDPLIIVTSDHGEEFGERGSWGHAHTLNPEQLRVPLIIAGPGVKTQVIETTVGLQDLAPTLAATLGEGWASDGIPLWGTLTANEAIPARAFLSDTSRFDTNRLGLWEGDMRLDWDLSTQVLTLYADPLEKVDVAAERPDDLARLQRQLISLLGTPWTAEPGLVQTTSATLFAQGASQGERWDNTESSGFALIPVDAAVWHGDLPPVKSGQSTGPLVHTGTQASSVGLTEAEKERLRQLGYME
ncbi:MAG: arylsulfatase A-like enzyme [Cognaticolwellia sp.]|jgi:arylsulfatase A-like enzyme